MNELFHDGTTPIIKACQLSQVDCVKLLLARGAEINFPGDDGNLTSISVIVIAFILAMSPLPSAEPKNNRLPLLCVPTLNLVGSILGNILGNILENILGNILGSTYI